MKLKALELSEVQIKHKFVHFCYHCFPFFPKGHEFRLLGPPGSAIVHNCDNITGNNLTRTNATKRRLGFHRSDTNVSQLAL